MWKKRSEASSSLAAARGRIERTRSANSARAAGLSSSLPIRPRAFMSLSSAPGAPKTPRRSPICLRRISSLTTDPTLAAPPGMSSESANFLDGQKIPSTAKRRAASASNWTASRRAWTDWNSAAYSSRASAMSLFQPCETANRSVTCSCSSRPSRASISG
jgi:hypothetical protein